MVLVVMLFYGSWKRKSLKKDIYLKTEEKVQKQTLGDLFADKLKEFK